MSITLNFWKHKSSHRCIGSIDVYVNQAVMNRDVFVL